jgi:tRNA A37 threonylcarbamoyladenosine dehydratase
MFVTPANIGEIDFSVYDFVVDAIDNVTAKLEIIRICRESGIKILSCMGTGNKLDPTRFRISDISKTSVCPLARVMRRELKVRGIDGVDVLWSDESPIRRNSVEKKPDEVGRACTGSVPFVPPVAGFVIAGYVVKQLTIDN